MNAIHITFFTASQDYVSISSMYLNFSSGVQRQNITVNLLDDDMFEVEETFNVTLSLVPTTDATTVIEIPNATVVIINNDRKK